MKNDRMHLFTERVRKNPEVLSHAVRVGDVLYVSGQLGTDVRTGKSLLPLIASPRP